MWKNLQKSRLKCEEVRGSMSSAGVGPLCFLKFGQWRPQPRSSRALPATLLTDCGDAGFIFQQDLASAHTKTPKPALMVVVILCSIWIEPDRTSGDRGQKEDTEGSCQASPWQKHALNKTKSYFCFVSHIRSVPLSKYLPASSLATESSICATLKHACTFMFRARLLLGVFNLKLQATTEHGLSRFCLPNTPR